MTNSPSLNRMMVAIGTALPTMPRTQLWLEKNCKRKEQDHYKGYWPKQWPCTKDHSPENVYVDKVGKLRCRICESELRAKRSRQSEGRSSGGARS